MEGRLEWQVVVWLVSRDVRQTTAGVRPPFALVGGCFGMSMPFHSWGRDRQRRVDGKCCLYLQHPATFCNIPLLPLTARRDRPTAAAMPPPTSVRGRGAAAEGAGVTTD